MATVVEQRSQPHFGGMGYDSMRYSAAPQFTNPWATANTSSPQAMYHPQLPPTSAPVDHQQHARHIYSHHPAATTAPLEPMPQPRSYAPEYVSTSPAAQATYAPTSGIRYSPEYHPNVSAYAAYDQTRRPSYPPKPQMPLAGRDSFNEPLDASRGMVAMSQDLTTPRNIYGPRNSSQDSYGFPATHSPHSSISSASGYPYYGSYSGSVDGSVAGSSVTDYSSASEDAMGQRTLPAPGQMISGFPPEPASMMTQFNSKLAASAQKKHKCKICDKRFTRPSSLQTHMYSHTGEKPFACDYEGCGRHFSVVSNLRRHKKCHKGGQERTSPDEE